MKMYLKALIFLFFMILGSHTVVAQTDDLDLNNTLYLDLEYGRVVIKMFPDVAPKHVEKIKKLTRLGFYDGVIFHRVIDGFMAQTGDPTGTGTGGSGSNVDAEFSDIPHLKGVLSMARAGARGNTPEEIMIANNSADSQFFICLGYSPHLDRQYTVWGEVVSGMRYVDQIKKGVVNTPTELENPDKIIKMQVAADVKE
jgi:peptidylprolyl isomerase